MAETSMLVLHFYLTVSTLSLLPFTLSRSFSNPSVSSTTFLDVSASLAQAKHVLSFDPKASLPFLHQQQQEEDQITSTNSNSNSNSSSFSLQLLPRESLRVSQHRDYQSLVLSRLSRDSARVKSLNAKLQLALNNVKHSDLQPLQTELQPEDLNSPIVSGSSLGSGEYFSQIGVGQPGKSFYMVLDTGSDINWLQCQPCSNCYQQVDPIFDPKSSSSFNSLSCDSQQCKSLETSSCRNEKCLYQVSYGDGSFTVGDFTTETLSFGNTGSVRNVALGCGHENVGLFVGAAGLLGLGGGPLSLTSQIKASSFSYCLVDRDSSSSSSLEFNSAEPVDSVTAPLLRNGKADTFYYVGLTGIMVGDQLVSIQPENSQMDESGSGGVIVDSGTSITRLRTQAYESLRDAFVKSTQHLPKAEGVSLFDTCYNLSSQSKVKVPTLSFRFSGGKSLSLPSKNYLIPVNSDGTFCLAFAATSSALSIIGNVQQQGTRVTFDLVNSRVGFSPDKC